MQLQIFLQSLTRLKRQRFTALCVPPHRSKSTSRKYYPTLKNDACAYIFDQQGLMVSLSIAGTKISAIKH
jgi:hypothetical protein